MFSEAKVDVQKGALKLRDQINNICVSFIHFTFSSIVFVWSQSSLVTMCHLVRLELGFRCLQTRGSWSSNGLPSVLLFRLWLIQGEFQCRQLAHLILDNSQSEVFACSQAQAAIQPHFGMPLECGGMWTHAARPPCTHLRIF